MHNNDSNLWGVIWPSLLACSFHLLVLDFNHISDSSITDSVSVQHDAVGKLVVARVEVHQGFREQLFEVHGDFFTLSVCEGFAVPF